MKYRIALALVLTSLSASAFANSPCQEKEQDIQREISYAEKHHNQSRIDGLNKALARSEQTAATVSSCRSSAKNRQTEGRDCRTSARPAGSRRKAMRTKSASASTNLNEAQQELKTLESRDY
jgi:hypothetical protein